MAVAIVLVTAATLAWAIPGYRINDDASAERGVHQFADDCDKFNAVVYEAYVDKSAWRLALAAHKYLQQKPGDPQRECSFAEAFWQSQQVGVSEQVPPKEKAQLEGLFEEAARDTEDAAKRLPKSAAAHITYGRYILLFVPGIEKVPQMIHEFQMAVALKPSSGYAHYMLANAYSSSADYSIPTSDKIIAESKRAVELDPRQKESYTLIAAAYWNKKDYRAAKLYMDKYIQVNPQAANRPDVVGEQKELAKKLADG